jgi:hypothetical protein
LKENLDNAVPLNVHPFHLEGKTMILQWAFKLKNTLAIEESQHSNSCTLMVKEYACDKNGCVGCGVRFNVILQYATQTASTTK